MIELSDRGCRSGAEPRGRTRLDTTNADPDATADPRLATWHGSSDAVVSWAGPSRAKRDAESLAAMRGMPAFRYPWLAEMGDDVAHADDRRCLDAVHPCGQVFERVSDDGPHVRWSTGSPP